MADGKANVRGEMLSVSYDMNVAPKDRGNLKAIVNAVDGLYHIDEPDTSHYVSASSTLVEQGVHVSLDNLKKGTLLYEGVAGVLSSNEMQVQVDDRVRRWESSSEKPIDIEAWNVKWDEYLSSLDLRNTDISKEKAGLQIAGLVRNAEPIHGNVSLEDLSDVSDSLVLSNGDVGKGVDIYLERYPLGINTLKQYERHEAQMDYIKGTPEGSKWTDFVEEQAEASNHVDSLDSADDSYELNDPLLDDLEKLLLPKESLPSTEQSGNPTTHRSIDFEL